MPDTPAQKRIRRNERRKNRLCLECGTKLRRNQYFRCKKHQAAHQLAARKWWKKKSPAYHKAASKRWGRTTKLRILNGYGGPVCRCCGETRIEFLSIDHIKGGGLKHRQWIKKHFHGMDLYRWLILKKFPKGFRVLCMNCNFAMKHGGLCPHQKERRNGIYR